MPNQNFRDQLCWYGMGYILYAVLSPPCSGSSKGSLSADGEDVDEEVSHLVAPGPRISLPLVA